MARGKQREMPTALVRARDRFRAWRGERIRGERIPRPLWASAVKLARAYGICRTASVLGLDYYSLKKRLEVASGTQAMAEPAFVELPASVALGKQCTIELDDGAGTTMRVYLASYDAVDVATLARSVWKGD